jgi:hypothetical protein
MASRNPQPFYYDISNDRSRASSDSGEGPFICRKIFVRGWTEFGDDDSKGELAEVLKGVGQSLVARLPSELSSYLEVPDQRFWDPRYRNRQLTINLHMSAPENAGFKIMSYLNDSFKSNPVLVLNKPIYITRDMELWQKQRNGALVRSKKAILPYLLPGISVVQDWPGGQLWLKKGDGSEVIVGFWKRDDGWTWRDESVKSWLPEADLGRLAESMA